LIFAKLVIKSSNREKLTELIPKFLTKKLAKLVIKSKKQSKKKHPKEDFLTKKL
jgi:hypothetical protein